MYLYLHSSYFLYSIGHPNKHKLPLFDITNDATEQSTEQGTESSTANTSRLDEVITKTLSGVGLQYPVTDHMRACFKSKLWRMGQKISKAGSTRRKKIFESWKTGKNSIWELHIDGTNVNNELVKLQKENEQKLASQCLQTLQLEKELTVARKEITRKMSENQELHNLLTTAEDDFKELQVSHKQLQESSHQQGRSSTNKQSSLNAVDQSKAKRKRTDFSVLSRQ